MQQREFAQLSSTTTHLNIYYELPGTVVWLFYLITVNSKKLTLFLFFQYRLLLGCIYWRFMAKRLRGGSISPNKQESEICLTCNKPVSDDALECLWYKHFQPRSCTKISKISILYCQIFLVILQFSVCHTSINDPVL